MNKESGSTSLDAEQRKLILEEYRDITKRVSSSRKVVWQTMTYMVGVALIAAVLAFVLGESSRLMYIGVYILGLGIMTILWLFLNRFVRREHWRRWVLYWRQRELEGNLHLGATRFIYELDLKFGKRQADNRYPEDIRESLNKLVGDKDLSYVSPYGHKFIDWVVRITMLIWVAVMVIVFFQWHNHSATVGYITLAIGAAWFFIMMFSCQGVPTSDRKR